MVLDAAYLKATVGPALSDGIAQAIAQLAPDPVEFLGEYLVRHADAAAKAKADAAEAERLRKQEALRAEAEAVKAHAAEKKQAAKAAQDAAEDSHFAAALAAADANEAAFEAVLALIRQRLGANAYVALADRPERVLPAPPAEAPAAVAPAEEAAEDEPAADEGEGEDGAPTPEPPAKHRPTRLEYVAATGTDGALLAGKELVRAEAPADGEEEGGGDGGEEEEGAAPKAQTGVGAGVSFSAIDAAMAAQGARPYTLWKDALTHPAVKFWYMPRQGDYLCVPFFDAAGECIGIVGVDNMGEPSHFGEEHCDLVLRLAQALAAKFEALELARLEREAAELAAMQAAFDAEQAKLAAQLETLEADDKDFLQASSAKLAAARQGLLALDKGKLAEIKGYKVAKPEVAIAVKAAFYLLGLAKRLPAWAKTRALLDSKLPWGGPLLAKIAAFEPAKKRRPKPFERAMKRLGDVSDEQFKKVNFVAFLLVRWVRAANEVFQSAAKAREAAAEAGAPAADELQPEADEEAEEEGGEDGEDGEDEDEV